jgi:hypothetical protein
MKFNVYDTTEISDIAWVSIAGMMNLRTNTDVNAFLENYNRYL